jgi:ADP-heptose:LPS heptosyltransferase
MKIVIITHSGIGNAIHTTPCAKALNAMGNDVVICTWPRSFGIIKDLPFAHVTIDHPVIHTMSTDHIVVSKCGAVWQDEWTHGVIHYAGPKKLPWEKHESEYYMDVARELGYVRNTHSPEIYISPTNQAVAASNIPSNWQDFVCINVGYLKEDHWHLKFWGHEKFSNLINNLAEHNQNVILVGGPKDQPDSIKIMSKILDHNKYKVHNLVGYSNDIKDTAAIIKSAKLLVGSDSGLQHVGASVQTPTVTIFHFTNIAKNRPYDAQNENLHKVVTVSCDDRPMCQHGKFDKCESRGCLDVSIEDVWRIVEESL